ncbi:MAG: tRNA (adenosine(37)-N6)-threonylcarbamoyltransferase complex dimerization subunit type 1 TsaB [Bacteroidetes bacterium]|nr:tRNA (adenosine(37)-N6)-threonylcarbamoyltransferase complex dimerization subunit type 1 TsaB [Bacteroidota bacterium]MBU1718772.1 tRNA (adenosine(37)-N6)-threonylcarbamoyltransferase complex dimerization subunit type 1 TsaB [Bacteroidota bacterium]
MAIILNIETATSVCSVALTDGGQVVFSEEATSLNAHSALLTVIIERILQESGIPLDAIAVSAGPGSYTGLRIGMSAAKGLAYSLDLPLISIGTLEVMAQGIIEALRPQNNVMLAPMIDARRMEVYTALYSNALEELSKPAAVVVDESIFIDKDQGVEIWYFGDGAVKCMNILAGRQGLSFISKFEMRAANMAILAEKKFKQKQFVDIAIAEPLYIKEFVSGTPNVKGLT